MKRITAPSLKKKKEKGERIAFLTAYDYPTAKLIDDSDIDGILVGDSCAMAVLGRPNTLSMTMDEMLHHVKPVAAAAERVLVVADMPFLSYHITPEEAVRNAGRLVAEGGAGAVKLEGPPERVGDAIEAILNACIPVMGHLGLTPQSIHQLGGFKVQGRGPEGAQRIKDAAKELEELGCFSIVLECVPPTLAAEITESLSIPTIGIGAGAQCDGQILVMHDILGWGETRFAKTFVDVRSMMKRAFDEYARDVKSGAYPAKEHQYNDENHSQQRRDAGVVPRAAWRGQVNWPRADHGGLSRRPPQLDEGSRGTG